MDHNDIMRSMALNRNLIIYVFNFYSFSEIDYLNDRQSNSGYTENRVHKNANLTKINPFPSNFPQYNNKTSD